MNKCFKNKNIFLLNGVVLLCFIATTLSLSGCEPLRKKFTRAKKKDALSTSGDPILEPIDYPASNDSAQKRYLKHYSLWNVWYRDCMEALSVNDNPKKQIYDVDQMITQFQEMNTYLKPEKQGPILQNIETLGKIRYDMEHPINLRVYKVQSILKTMAEQMKKDYKIDKIKGDLIILEGTIK